jgi:hypothetical protein
MAIKLTAHFSKKAPLAVQFSMQTVGASIEVEIGSDAPDDVRRRLQEMYKTLSDSVDEHIAVAQRTGSASQAHVVQEPATTAAPRTANTIPKNSNGQMRRGSSNVARSNGATAAQQRAIYALTKAANVDLANVLADYNAGTIEQLTVRDASRLIDSLKTQQNGHARP